MFVQFFFPLYEDELQSKCLNLSVQVSCCEATCGVHWSPLKPSWSLEEQGLILDLTEAVDVVM